MFSLLGGVPAIGTSPGASRLMARTGLSRPSEFESFFVEHYGAVTRTLTMITGDAELAADSVQEAFQRAYVRWGRIRRYDAPEAWVRRVAINVSRDLLRSQANRRRNEERAASNELVDMPEPQVDSDVPALLASLPHRQRVAMTLYYLDQLSVSQVATAMDISEGAVKYHLNQGREKLRPLLAERARR